MTQKLFYENPYVREFEARIEQVESGDGGMRVVLAETHFYPEGGGQPADHGIIGGHLVVDVRKEGDEVVHILKPGPGEAEELVEGSIVNARIDWDRRHDYMQQHTGQHIISAALLTIGEYNTVSVHQGEEYTTVEVDSEEISADALHEVEALANRIIQENRSITDHWVTDADIHRYPLRRPPKVTGSIRLVMVDDFDCVACGGVHAHTSGEVGLVKCIGIEKIRGNLRTIWKIGDRAYADYALKHDIVSTLGRELSAPPEEILERIHQLQSQTSELRREAGEHRVRIARLTAGEIYSAADEIRRTDSRAPGTRAIVYRFEGEDKELFRAVAEDLAVRPDAIFCLVNDSGNQLQWTIGHGSAGSVDFAVVRSNLLPLIGGKGGGRPPIWQGAGSDSAGIDLFFEQFLKLCARGPEDSAAG